MQRLSKRAWLFSETLGRFTAHEYAGLAPAEFVPAVPATPGNWEAHEVLYRCTETGVARRWGSSNGERRGMRSALRP